MSSSYIQGVRIISGPQAVMFVRYHCAERSIIKFCFSACSSLICGSTCGDLPRTNALKFPRPGGLPPHFPVFAQRRTPKYCPVIDLLANLAIG
jgi:hypothetical protein